MADLRCLSELLASGKEVAWLSAAFDLESSSWGFVIVSPKLSYQVFFASCEVTVG